MANNNNNNEQAVTVIENQPITLPATMAELKPETLKAIGITGAVSAARARANLRKSGVDFGISDSTAVLADVVNSSIDKANSAFKNAGLALGLINHYRAWTFTPGPNGKVYGEKGQKRFFRDLFPNFSDKTLIAYARAGEEVYLPIAMKDDAFEGLERLAELPPSVVKEVTTIAGTDEGRDALRKVVPAKGENSKMPTQRELAAVRKAVKGEDTNKPDEDANPGPGASADEIAEQLKGGALIAKFNRLFPSYVDDSTNEFQITVTGESASSEAGEWLKAASADADKALEFVQLLYKAYVKAVPVVTAK